jgi:hypothetical protein
MDKTRNRRLQIIANIAIVVGLILIFRYVVLKPNQPQQVPYSQFLQAIDESKSPLGSSMLLVLLRRG